MNSSKNAAEERNLDAKKPAIIAEQQSLKQNIAFSLSESSFALFPPLERHEGDFPKITQPSMLSSIPSGTALSTMASAPGTEDAYPVEPTSRAMDLHLEESRLSELMVAAALSYPPPPHKHGPIVIVSSYTQFGDLAHGPRGVEAQRSMRTYRLNISDGTLTLLSMTPEGEVHNPAFTRRHPTRNVVYSCTESVKEEGEVVAFALDGRTGALSQHCAPAKAGGFSTCYLTIHKAARRMLLVNYWDSTICTLELTPDGKIGERLAEYDPKDGKKMKASADGHVNHSRNDDEAQAERQGDPHSHAIVLEPTTGTIAYVPDLGMDVIRQFHFDEQSGAVTPCGIIPSGVKAAGQRRGLGPRYIQFAKDLHTCYVVNELSSQVAVFAYDPLVAAVIAEESSKATTLEERREVMSRMEPTLKLVQTVSTLPEAFPRECNTCGRITIHPSGDFVVTSNRGHDSIAVHRIHRDANPPGLLTLAGIFHTRGETPRHFQFDKSGQWLLVANQDSNTVAVFNFNGSSGKVSYSGNAYSCPSPNFVCVWDGA